MQFKILIQGLFKKKPKAVILKIEDCGAGAFYGQKKIFLIPYTDFYYDEEDGYEVKIQYMCNCGLEVFRLRDEHFGCTHCDAVCVMSDMQNKCEICFRLFTINDNEEE